MIFAFLQKISENLKKYLYGPANKFTGQLKLLIEVQETIKIM